MSNYPGDINPSAILWDMDGTIIDTEPAWIEAEEKLLKRYGATIHDEDLIDWVGIGLWDLAEIFISRGVELSADNIIAELTAEVNKTIFSSKEIPWRPGAVTLLKSFKEKGIPNILVTMATRSQALEVLDRLPQNTFSKVVGGDDTPKPKPHPEPYILGAATLGFKAENCVAIEDSLTGIASAKSAGAFVIGVPHIVDISDSGANLLVASLEELDADSVLEHFASSKKPRKLDI